MAIRKKYTLLGFFKHPAHKNFASQRRDISSFDQVTVKNEVYRT